LAALGCAKDDNNGQGGYPAAPIAVAKAAKTTATVGDLVELDGSRSSDPEGLPLSFHWDFLEVPVGSSASLNSRTLRKPSFYADMAGKYVIALTVDNNYWVSDQVEVTLNVVACQPIIESLGALPETPEAGTLVQVAAIISEECGEQPPYEYKWAFSSLPAGSGATFNDAAVVAPSFLPDVDGDYVVTLVVIDALGRRSEYATRTVTVRPLPPVECGDAEPVAVVEPLWTDANIDLAAYKVGVPAKVQITGRASTDADNAAPCSLAQGLFYVWRFIALPAGSEATLNNNQIVNPSFNADRAGDYVVGLTVLDSTGLVSKETAVTIKAGS
jgi:PKD repeat protein